MRTKKLLKANPYQVWGCRRSKEMRNPDVKPWWASYWDDEKHRWFSFTPEEHAKHRLDEIRKDTNWAAQKRKHDRYKLSPRWFIKSSTVKKRDKYTCRICGKTKGVVVHHLTYISLGDESLYHLITLCHACHHNIHYDEQGRRRRDWKRYNPKPVKNKLIEAVIQKRRK